LALPVLLLCSRMWRVLCLATAYAAATLSSAVPLEPATAGAAALTADDECQDGAQCGLNMLQLRKSKDSEARDESRLAPETALVEEDEDEDDEDEEEQEEVAAYDMPDDMPPELDMDSFDLAPGEDPSEYELYQESVHGHLPDAMLLELGQKASEDPWDLPDPFDEPKKSHQKHGKGKKPHRIMKARCGRYTITVGKSGCCRNKPYDYHKMGCCGERQLFNITSVGCCWHPYERNKTLRLLLYWNAKQKCCDFSSAGKKQPNICTLTQGGPADCCAEQPEQCGRRRRLGACSGRL